MTVLKAFPFEYLYYYPSPPEVSDGIGVVDLGKVTVPFF